ncbi:uncharacterized protein LOC116413540 [Galleria mellonella]|uniref:Uncharacterized protein LOC116413540 n=1 Tax=Galleria mellonella TaxID=7137 RepID=A0A6J3C913_GALME|nr:uncharacterized protein LOC116413540 [Galleria mellonella]
MVDLQETEDDFDIQEIEPPVENPKYESFDFKSFEPNSLSDLELLAGIAANYMSDLSGLHYTNCQQVAMNYIRQLHNMEFKLRCDVCGTAHYQNEISAPER